MPLSASHSRAADFDQRLQHDLQIEGRAADDLEHVGGGGLLLQRLAQLVEQAGVLDGDDGLGGEVRDQLDLLVGERPHLLAIDGDHADQLALLEHRHHENGARAGRLGERYRPGLAIEVGRFSSEVGDVLHPPGLGNASKGILRTKTENRIAEPQLRPRRRSAVHRGYTKGITFVQQKIAKLGLADARGVLQHRLEHRLQFARRARDDLQHVGGRGLLLQRLAQLVEQPRVLDRDDGLGGEVRDQLDLLVGERPDLLAVDRDGANGSFSFSIGTTSRVRMPASSRGNGRITAE